MRRILGLFLSILFSFTFATAWAQEVTEEPATEETPEVVEETIPEDALFKVSFVDGTEPVYYTDTETLYSYLRTTKAASSPVTVTLLKDVTTNTWHNRHATLIPHTYFTAHVIFDLNGKTWQSNISNCIQNDGVMTICDSKGTGKFLAETDRYTLINNRGFLEIKGGTFDVTSYNVIVNNGGTLLIRGGAFRSSGQHPINNAVGRLEIAGGTFDVPVSNAEGATCRIYGGSFKTEGCVPAGELLATGCSILADDGTGYRTVVEGEGYVKTENLGYLRENTGTLNIPYDKYNCTESMEIVGGDDSLTLYHYVLLADAETVKYSGTASTSPTLELNGCAVKALEVSASAPLDVLGPGKIETISGFEPGMIIRRIGTEEVEPPLNHHWTTATNGDVILEDAYVFEVKLDDGTTTKFVNLAGLNNYFSTTPDLSSPVTITLVRDVTTSEADASLTLTSNIKARIFLDLNGKVWTTTRDKTIINESAFLTIRDSQGNGSLKYTLSDSAFSPISNNGILKIDSGTFEPSSGQTSGSAISNTGMLLVRGGTFADASEGTNCKSIYNTGSGQLEIVAGTFDVPVENEATCRIRGGSFETVSSVPATGLLAAGCTASADDTGYSTVTVTDEASYVPTENFGFMCWPVDGSDGFSYTMNKRVESLAITDTSYYYFFLDDASTVQCNGTSETPLTLELNGCTVTTLEISEALPLNIIGPGKIENIIGFQEGISVKRVGTEAVELPYEYGWMKNDNGEDVLEDARIFKVTFADGSAPIYYTSIDDLDGFTSTYSGITFSPVTITLLKDVTSDWDDVLITSGFNAHVIVDLNGKTWSSTSRWCIRTTKNAILTICDSSEAQTGKLSTTTPYDEGELILNSGFLEIQSGTFEVTPSSDSVNQVHHVANEGGYVFIRGGKFPGSEKVSFGNTENGHLEIVGGEFDVSVSNAEGATCRIRGGAFKTDVFTSKGMSTFLATGCTASANTATNYSTVEEGSGYVKTDSIGYLKVLRRTNNNGSSYEAHKWTSTVEFDDTVFIENSSSYNNPAYLDYVLLEDLETLKAVGTPDIPWMLELNGRTVKTLAFTDNVSLTIRGSGKIEKFSGYNPNVKLTRIGDGKVELPKGYRWAEDDNGDIILEETDNFEVTLGDGKKETFTSDITLQEYLNAGALSSPVTITLQNDVVASDFQLNLSSQAYVILDLNGYTWEAPQGECAIKNNSAVLTICDNSAEKDGKIVYGGSSTTLPTTIYNNGGFLEITGGTFDCSSGSAQAYTIWNTGTILIREGVFSSAKYKPIYNVGRLEIAGGTFDQLIMNDTAATCLLRGGLFKLSVYASTYPDFADFAASLLATGCEVVWDASIGYETVQETGALNKAELLGAVTINKEGDGCTYSLYACDGSLEVNDTTVHYGLLNDFEYVKYNVSTGTPTSLDLSGYTLGKLELVYSSSTINIRGPGKIEKFSGYNPNVKLTLIGDGKVELPRGFAWVTNSDGAVVLGESDHFEVTLGDGTKQTFTTDDSLKTYLNSGALPSPVTITLKSDVAGGHFKITKANVAHVILDLNGYTWEAMDGTAVIENESMVLTIRDSSEAKAGKLIYTGTDNTATLIKNSSILEITGGTFHNKHTSGYTIFNDAKLLIRDGTFLGESNNPIHSTEATHLEIAGGTFDVQLYYSSTVLRFFYIRGGLFNTSSGTIQQAWLAPGYEIVDLDNTGYKKVTGTITNNAGLLCAMRWGTDGGYEIYKWSELVTKPELGELYSSHAGFLLFDNMPTIKCKSFSASNTTPSLELNGFTVSSLAFDKSSLLKNLDVYGPGKIKAITGFIPGSVVIRRIGDAAIEPPCGYGWVKNDKGEDILTDIDRFKVTLADGTEKEFTGDAAFKSYLSSAGALVSPVTVTLMSDVAASDVVFGPALQAHVVIDLNGYTWEAMDGNCALSNSVIMTICDRSDAKTGKILYTSLTTNSAPIMNAGFLDIAGGRIEASSDQATNTIMNYGNLFVRDGTIRGANNDQTIISYRGTVEIAGGTFDVGFATATVPLGTITYRIRGGSFIKSTVTLSEAWMAEGYSSDTDPDNSDYNKVTVGEGYDPTKNIGSVSWNATAGATTFSYQIHKWTPRLTIDTQYTNWVLLTDYEELACSGEKETATYVSLNGATIGTFMVSKTLPFALHGPGTFEAITGFEEGAKVTRIGAKEIALPIDHYWKTEESGEVVLTIAEAEVNGVAYERVKDACEAAREQGTTVNLVRDVTRFAEIFKDVTIDLKGFDLFPAVKNNATLTVIGPGALDKIAFDAVGGTILKVDGAEIGCPVQFEWQDNRLVCKNKGIYINSPKNGELYAADLASMIGCVADYVTGDSLTTVTLLGDLEDDGWAVPSTKRMTFDLNGKTLTLTGSSEDGVLRNQGLLQLSDTVGGGLIKSTSTSGKSFILNTGNFALMGGQIEAPTKVLCNSGSGRLLIAGGAVFATTAEGVAVEFNGTGGSEITGGVIIGALSETTSTRIRGGHFTADPTAYVVSNFYTATQDATGVWTVYSTVVTASKVAKAATGVTKFRAGTSVGTLTKTSSTTGTLSLDSPYAVVEGATVVMNGEEVTGASPASDDGIAVMALATSTGSENAIIEANKTLDLLNAVYTVTIVNGNVVLSYDYAFNVEGMEVTSKGDTTDVTLKIVLREGKNLAARKAELTKARLIIDHNDQPIVTPDENLVFAAGDGFNYKLSDIETQPGKANLFRARLEPKIAH